MSGEIYYPCACGRTHSIPDCWRELGAKSKPNTDALRAAAGLPPFPPRADGDSCFCMGNHSAEEARLYGLHCHPAGLRPDEGGGLMAITLTLTSDELYALEILSNMEGNYGMDTPITESARSAHLKILHALSPARYERCGCGWSLKDQIAVGCANHDCADHSMAHCICDLSERVSALEASEIEREGCDRVETARQMLESDRARVSQDG